MCQFPTVVLTAFWCACSLQTFCSSRRSHLLPQRTEDIVVSPLLLPIPCRRWNKTFEQYTYWMEYPCSNKKNTLASWSGLYTSYQKNCPKNWFRWICFFQNTLLCNHQSYWVKVQSRGKKIGYSKQKTGGLGPKPVDEKTEIAKKNEEVFKKLLLWTLFLSDFVLEWFITKVSFTGKEIPANNCKQLGYPTGLGEKFKGW